MDTLEDTFYTPATCITEHDYIKVISTEQEFQQVVELMKQVFPDHWEDLEQEGLENNQLSQGRYILGYFTKDNKLIASVRLREVELYKLVAIFALQVEFPYRGKKVATELFRFIKKVSKEREFLYLNLFVRKNNKRALRLYKKWKFKQMPTIYRINSFCINKLMKFQTPSDYSFRQVSSEDYEKLIIPFFKQNFTPYLNVYNLKSNIRPLVEKHLVQAYIIQAKLKVILVQSLNQKVLDIYLSEKLKDKSIHVSKMLASKNDKIQNFKLIKILGNLTSDDIRKLKKHSIHLEPSQVEYSLFYELTNNQ